MLKAGDRQLDRRVSVDPDRDVDDPVLLAAHDRVAGQQQHRLPDRTRVHGGNGRRVEFLDTQRPRRECLLAQQEHGQAAQVRRMIRCAQRDEGQPLARHRDQRLDTIQSRLDELSCPPPFLVHDPTL